MDVQVFLAGWEIECCQPPPGEGDLVEWPLLWVDEPAGPGALEVRWRARAARQVWRGDRGLHLAHGPLRAWWRGAAPGGVPVRGCLVADLHGGLPDRLTPTRGRVQSVRVVEQAYHRTRPRTYEPIAGAFVLRPVARSPAEFSGPPFADGDPLPDVIRQDSGVLVGLLVEASGG